MKSLYVTCIILFAQVLGASSEVFEVENEIVNSGHNNSYCLSVRLEVGIITIHSLAHAQYHSSLKYNLFIGSPESSYLQVTQFYTSQYILHPLSQSDWESIQNRLNYIPCTYKYTSTVHQRANLNYGRVLRSPSSAVSEFQLGSHVDKVVLGIPYISISDTCASNSLMQTLGGVLLFEDDVVVSRNIVPRLVESIQRLAIQGIDRYILSLYMPDFEGVTRKRATNAKYTYLTEIKENFSCTQAVFYPPSVKEELGEALYKNHLNFTLPYDKFIELYCRENNIKIYGVTMVQHIGRSGTGLGTSEHTANFFDVNY